ncbi:hypothetical protein [Facklamia hominis]|uniref:Uncharacterized protein n=1 Tax=Facklamia hominis CCUG 36813 TaxID=883111 RepID=K1LNK0_9LACT|nr:hypothetical protein [Facklamia hominis]EKB56311.1 hypothetical protein HMPREF9706_00294 [Facklamia hominis CCUG 36813]
MLKNYGYNGLVNKKRACKLKQTSTKKTNIHQPKKHNKSEREELIRLSIEKDLSQMGLMTQFTKESSS